MATIPDNIMLCLRLRLSSVTMWQWQSKV